MFRVSLVPRKVLTSRTALLPFAIIFKDAAPANGEAVVSYKNAKMLVDSSTVKR
jgi:hypothetical protein